MKKMIIASTLAFAGAIAAVEILPHDARPSNCAVVGEVKAGDLFATLDRETAIDSVKAQAEAKQANKIALDLASVTHGKLGKQFYAKAVAFKCN